MLRHGLALCDEYKHRYNKTHSCHYTLDAASKIFPRDTPQPYWEYEFTFAGPDEFKYDTSIDIFTAYKRYVASKPWVATNYLRDPSRKPNWLS